MTWQIESVKADSEELGKLLSEGWEPFAVTTVSGLSWVQEYVWLRRQVSA